MGRPLVLVVAVGLLLRVAVAAILPDGLLRDPSNDPDAYARFARNLAATGVYGIEPGEPSAYRPPLYPLVLVPFSRGGLLGSLGILAVHLLASAIAIVATMRLATALGARHAVVAGLVIALDPLLVKQAAVLMSETVFLSLLTLFLLAAVRLLGQREHDVRGVTVNWHWLWAGLFLGLATLTRPIAGPIGVAFLPVAALTGHGRSWLRVLMVASLVVAPWFVRNGLVLGVWTPATTHGGYTLWLGQNPTYYAEVVAGPHAAWPDAAFADWYAQQVADTARMTEVERDQWYRQRAVEWMRTHPGRAAQSVGQHVVNLWRPVPLRGSPYLRVAVGAFVVALYAVAAMGVVKLARSRGALGGTFRGWMLLLAVVLVVTLVHAFYWSDVRMRAPVVPVLAISFALGSQLVGGGLARQTLSSSGEGRFADE